MIFKLLVPIAVEVIKSYIKSSSTSKDDKVLEIVQEGAKYLSQDETNAVPMAVGLIRDYMSSPDTTKDEKVLEVVREGSIYLSEGSAYDVSLYASHLIVNSKPKE